MVVRDVEKALVGWATTKSGDTAPATVVDGSQTSHSLQLAVRTEMRDKVAFRSNEIKVRSRPKAAFHIGSHMPQCGPSKEAFAATAKFQANSRNAGHCRRSSFVCVLTQHSLAGAAQNTQRSARFLQTGRSCTAHPQDFRLPSRCDRFQPASILGMPLLPETSADP